MEVVVSGKRLRLDPNDLLGAGGEGSVYKTSVNGDVVALKVYHQPTTKRGEKLQAMINSGWQLPLNKIGVPQDVVFDASGKKIIGLYTSFLSGFEELVSLSNKKYRASYKVNTQQVAKIFLDGADTLKQVHANGLCVGDFNDMNGLFRGYEMLFIDVDAWQFGIYPCPVGSEQFLAPELYGIDLSLKPVFKPDHDWYSYAVMLFKSLLLVHPYGGIHKGYKQLTGRAKNRVTVFDPGVKYPQIAIAPDLLDDSLSQVFHEYFANGKRGVFPVNTLEAYLHSLVECQKCGTWYPHTRQQCPVCTEKTVVVITAPVTVTKGATIADFIRTNGTVIYSRLVGTKLYLIVNENGMTVLYSKSARGPLTRKELFGEIAGAKYELLGEDVLVVGQPNTTELLLVDISGEKIKPLTKKETAIFAGNRRAMFRTSDVALFRIIGGNLMYGSFNNEQYVERALRTVMSNQTWFTMKHESDGNKPTGFGFFQIMNQQMYWLLWEGRQYDNLPLSEMEAGETLIDISVKFSSQGAMIRRHTQFQGVDYLRTNMVSSDGKVVYSSARIRKEDHPANSLHGQAYSTSRLLHATDEGVMQEKIETGETKTFETTKGHVVEGDTLYAFEGGLLVVKDDRAIHIVLS